MAYRPRCSHLYCSGWRAVLAATLLTQPYGFHFIFISPRQKKIKITGTCLRVATRRSRVCLRERKVRKRRRRDIEGSWCVCVWAPVISVPPHPIYFGGDCFRDSTISRCHHHSSCPRSRAWDVALHRGIVDQYWLICATWATIGAHLCLARCCVCVINMEDKHRVGHNFLTLQKLP